MVVIAFAKFQYISLTELWIEFGVGKHLKYLSTHDMSRNIGKEKSQALLAFQAFKGCDKTSSFAHYSKKTAWGASGAFHDVTAAFQALRNLFARKGRDIEAIPPTSDALHQHAKRSTYQAGYCWGNSLGLSPSYPCLSEWGGVKVAKDMWEPLWMTIPQALQSCQELLKCGCKSERGCAGRCKCIKAEISCTALFNCAGLSNRE